jgi:RNA polymerase sigma factor (sigma-70 family)
MTFTNAQVQTGTAPSTKYAEIAVESLTPQMNKTGTPRNQAAAAAFEEIWRSHAKRLLRITQRITKNYEDAEDALQDSFMRAYIHRDDFDGRSSLSTWLTRIAINSALMILRKRSANQEISMDDNGESFDAISPTRLSDIIPDQSPSPETQYAQHEESEIVRDGIRELRPSVRRVVELQTMHERSLKETAQAMGLSLSATKSRLFHARIALRRSLRPRIGRDVRRSGHLQLSPA